MRRWLRALAGLVSSAALLSLLGVGACENYDGTVLVACPPAEEFALVSRVLEKRCGTLDCHGSLARPLRVYGQRGLRLLSDEERQDLTATGYPGLILENDTVPGGKATTDEELRATRRSICGLEPDRMLLFQNGDIAARDLMLLRKPLEIERHKGGSLLVEGGAGFTCITSWLEGDPNDGSCLEAAQAL